MVAPQKVYLVVLLALGLNSFPELRAQQKRTAAIQELVDSKFKEYKLPGVAVGVMQAGNIIYENYSGVANQEPHIPLNRQHLFHTASISKLFTAQAIIELQNSGKIKIDDPIVSFWPEFKLKDKRYTQITVRQLLNHSSGMPDVKDYQWGSRTSLEEYGQQIARKRLLFDPGTEFRYSNMAYELLGLLIQRLSGMLFQDYLKEHVLLPANMSTSDFDYSRLPEVMRVVPYTRGRGSHTIQPRSRYPYNPAHAPSSTLNSNIRELLAWTHSMISPDGKNNALFKEMTEPSEISSRVGLGWFLGNLDGVATAFHYGGDRGFRSYLLVIPEQQLSMVILGNCDYAEDFRQEILHGIYGILQTE